MKRIPLLLGMAMLLSTGFSSEKKSQGGDVNATTSSTPAAPTTTATLPATSTTTGATTTATAPTATTGITSAAATITVPNVVGKDLQLAQDIMQAAGLYNLTSHDSTGLNRSQVLDRNWQVTDQTPAAGSKVAADQRVDLGAKKFTD